MAHKWEENDRWVTIYLDRCIGAGECVEVCPAEVYIVINGKVDAENIGSCIACGSCEGVCPTNAIISHSAWK